MAEKKFGHLDSTQVVTLSPFPGSTRRSWSAAGSPTGRAATILCTCGAEFFVEAKHGEAEFEFDGLAKAHVLTHVGGSISGTFEEITGV